MGSLLDEAKGTEQKSLLEEARSNDAISVHEAPQSPSFFESIKKDWEERYKKVKESGLSSSAVKAVYTAGQVAGGMGDILGEVGSKITPDYIKQGFQDTAKAGIEAFENTFPGVTDNLKSAIKKNPDFFKGVGQAMETALNIGQFIPVGGKATKTAEETVSTALDTGVTALEKKTMEQTKNDTLSMVKRDFSTLTKKEREAALSSGKVEKPGTFKQAVLKTTQQDKDIAASVEGIVDPKKHPIENIDNIRAGIADLAEKTQALPAEYDKPLDTNAIRARLNEAKSESSLVFAGDTTKEKMYNAAIDAYMKILKAEPNNLSSVLSARKKFDAFMKSKFPNVFSKTSGDNVIANAIKDVRMAANDFVAESLPEGNEFKSLLQKQSNMYRATERIAQNASPSIDKSKFQRLTSIMAKHPWVTAESAAAATAGAGAVFHYGFGSAIVNTITSPIALASLALYGTYKVGNVVLNSRMVRDSLVSFLKNTKEALTNEERNSIQKVILGLSMNPALAVQTTKKTMENQ